ncbi:MAG: hypothetical protein JXR96_25215 [Deltaproteobacteria bacterium]|nr:hypothetical protein [Deltaproteobacteria bacterium]
MKLGALCLCLIALCSTQAQDGPQTRGPGVLSSEAAAACLAQLEQDRHGFFEALECLAERAPAAWLKAQERDWFSLIRERDRKRARRLFFGGGPIHAGRKRLYPLAVVLLERLLGAGDRRALGDFGAWVVEESRIYAEDGPFDDDLWILLEPLLRRAGHPEVERAGERIFGRGGTLESVIIHMLGTPLVALGAFRARALALLGDTRPVDVMRDRLMEFDWNCWPGALDMRVCDRAASHLACIQGMPLFDPTAAVEWRDGLIADMREHLQEYGSTARPFGHPRPRARLGVDFYSLHPGIRRPFRSQAELRQERAHGPKRSDGHMERDLFVSISGKRRFRLGVPAQLSIDFYPRKPHSDVQIPTELWRPRAGTHPAALVEGFEAELQMQDCRKRAPSRSVPRHEELGRLKAYPRGMGKLFSSGGRATHFCELDLAGIWQIDEPGHYTLTILGLPIVGELDKPLRFELDILPALEP